MKTQKVVFKMPFQVFTKFNPPPNFQQNDKLKVSETLRRVHPTKREKAL